LGLYADNNIKGVLRIQVTDLNKGKAAAVFRRPGLLNKGKKVCARGAQGKLYLPAAFAAKVLETVYAALPPAKERADRNAKLRGACRR
jgi:hypothetical protein